VQKEALVDTVAQVRRKYKGIEVSFSGRGLTPFGGIGLLGRLMRKLKVKETLESKVQLARRERKYSLGDMLLSVIYARALDLERLSDTIVLRKDGVFQQVVGFDDYPHESSLSRFLSKFTVGAAKNIGEVSVGLRRTVRDKPGGQSRLTLDMDSHVTTVYGKQQRAKVGYNPKKPGRKSYHPLLCFVGETRDFLWGRFRSGDRNNVQDSKGFLKECLVRLGAGVKELFLRADSGFYSDNFLKCLERRRIWYAVVAKLYPAIQAQLAGLEYRDIGSGVEVAEFQYQGLGWKKARRMVVIREEIAEGEKKKKEPKLLELKGHTYQVIVTNIEDWLPEEVWRFYNERANVENMVKEGVMGYGLDVAVSHSYAGNMAHFFITMLTYNLMNWLKEGVLGQQKVKRMAKWIRQHFFLIPGRLVRKGRKLILRLSQSYPWKQEYWRAEARLETLKLPLPS
jgi:hypothetical protein